MNIGAEGPSESVRLIYPVIGYESESSRVKGFQELLRLGLRAPDPIMIMGHEAFLEWKEEGVTERLKEEIGRVFDQIRKENEARGAYIGRAFYVPGIENPNGPRTADIWDKEIYIGEVVKFWEFVQQHGYDVPGADIALVFHPFINAMDERERYGELDVKGEGLPWSGGYIVSAPVPGREKQVKIVATFGPDEAVQSCPFDTLLIDPEREIVVEKKIVLKTETLDPLTGTSEYKSVRIADAWQAAQALTDREAIDLAGEAWKVFSHKPDTRLEFIMQPDGPYIREIAWWQFDERGLFRFEMGEVMIGSVVRVETKKDVEKISGEEAIVYFPPEAFRRRTTDLFAMVANLGLKRLVALTHGVIETSHMVRVLSDGGGHIVLVGDQEFSDGEVVKIGCREGGLPMVELVDSYHEAVVGFGKVEKLVRGVAGNKVAKLARMKAAGLPVPDGFGITSSAIWQYLTDIGVYREVALLGRLSLSNIEEIEQVTERIRAGILESKLPENLELQIRQAIGDYSFNSYSIRSSGSEDDERRSKAGMFESSVDVLPDKVPEKIKETIASYFSAANVVELRQRGLSPSRMPIGVGVHEFVPIPSGSTGVVVFTDENQIKIEATSGSPEGLAKGLAKDFVRYKVRRSDTKITTKSEGEMAVEVEEETLKKLIDLIKSIEVLFWSYQDVELIITPEGEIVVFQARPM